MELMHLSTEVLYLIAEEHPSIALASTNHIMQEIVNKIFDSSAKFIEREWSSLNHSPMPLNQANKIKRQYFNELLEEVKAEAQRLDNRQPDLSHLSTAEKIMWGYIHFRDLIEEVKLKTRQAQKEDFKKVVEAIAIEIDYPDLISLDPQAAWEMIKNNQWQTGIQELHLSGKNIRFLPPEIGDLKNLRQLYLDNNQLKTLPEEIKFLSSLQTLSLNNNQLINLPDRIQLPELESFELRHNHLEQVPNLSAYPKLKYMFLHHNGIKEIPTEVDSHPSLTKIYLKNNPIRQIPSALSTRVEIDVPAFNLNHHHLTSDRFED